MTEFAEFIATHPDVVDPEYFQKLSRHLALTGWDTRCQNKLDSLRILIVGAGGLGSCLAVVLCGSLFENAQLTIIDNDHIEDSNLHRQLPYMEEDIGVSKAETLAKICQKRNHRCRVEGITDSFQLSNSLALFENHDVIFDCTDNLTTRTLISDTWISTGRSKIVVSASCVGWCGQLVTLKPSVNFCLRCIYGEPRENRGCDRIGQCALQGVMGPVVSMMASLQLLELINNIRTHFEGPSFLSTIDMNGGMSVRELSLTPNCSLCTDGKAHSAGLMEHASISSPRDLHISSTDFLELLKKKECTVIDVRERNHFDCSHLIESTNFPASAFLHSGLPLGSSGEFSELISKLDRTLVVVCRRGIDSLLFAQKVNDTWPHVKIVSLDGGLYGLNVRVI